jgi:hypothetical protein
MPSCKLKKAMCRGAPLDKPDALFGVSMPGGLAEREEKKQCV